MTDADFDAEYAEQQLDMHDTIVWDEIYARACRQATGTGFAQLILEHGPADYALVNGRDPDALRDRTPSRGQGPRHPRLGRVAADGAGSTTRQYGPEAPALCTATTATAPAAELAHSHSR